MARVTDAIITEKDILVALLYSSRFQDPGTGGNRTVDAMTKSNFVIKF